MVFPCERLFDIMNANSKCIDLEMRIKMNKYENGKFVLYSDFEIRKIREEDTDIDLLIPLDLRVLNLQVEGMPKDIDGRFQFSEVRNIIIRFTTDKDNNYCTIHLLKSIDLHSAIVNFSLDYSNRSVEIRKSDFSVDMKI